MHIVELEQGTDEWLDWRANRFSASDASIIMQCRPDWMQIRSWERFRRHHGLFGNEPREDEGDFLRRAAAYGHRVEPVARRRFAPTTRPVCVEARGDDWRFAASLDGWDPGENLWAEIKCPIAKRRSKHLRTYRANRDGPMRERIQPYVWWQLVHQAAVIGDPEATCQFIVWVDRRNWVNARIEARELLLDWPQLEEGWYDWLQGRQPPRVCESCGSGEWSLDPLVDGECTECRMERQFEEEVRPARILRRLDAIRAALVDPKPHPRHTPDGDRR